MASKVLRDYGEDVFNEYCLNYERTISSLELKAIEIFKTIDPLVDFYNHAPKEKIDLRCKPDFRLEKNNKVLYINVDGLYHHSERKKSNHYHFNLREKFQQADLRLMQFREDELRDKPEIIRSLILNYFGEYNKKIGARECIIKQVSKDEANEFFNTNHLMGSYKSAAPFGLYYNDQLVVCMSVRIKKNVLDIARLATKNNYKVLGGLSRLLKFIKTKYNNISKIISFCDFRYASGKGYMKVGFKLESTSLGWKWTDEYLTYNRLKCKANMDKRKLTQQQYADELHWCKIYDAGQGKFIM